MGFTYEILIGGKGVCRSHLPRKLIMMQRLGNDEHDEKVMLSDRLICTSSVVGDITNHCECSAGAHLYKMD